MKTPPLSRRSFLRQASVTGGAFLGLQQHLQGRDAIQPLGPLIPDPHQILDLPEGFSYQVLSRQGDKMDDGFSVPGQPDGMAAFPSSNPRHTILVRNHEIGHSKSELGPFKDNSVFPAELDPALSYHPGSKDIPPFVGGTSNIVYNHEEQRVVREFLSLTGTDRNCAGGPTPWNTWVTCEEPEDLESELGRRHGYCFEVPASERPHLAPPVALKDMGRFRHEAIAVEPESGIVYLTEDRPDGLFYRFIPHVPGMLHRGGRLQALRLKGTNAQVVTNRPDSPSPRFPIHQPMAVEWLDMEDVAPPQDNLRLRGRQEQGATVFTRAEGIWYAGNNEQHPTPSIYFCCTDGGQKKWGQIFRYIPSEFEGTPAESRHPGTLELFLEPDDSRLLENGDNLTIAPWGDIVICEDAKNTNCLRGVTPKGEIYTIGLNTLNPGELAGACFGPDGTLYVNIQKRGTTLAVNGPWHRRLA